MEIQCPVCRQPGLASALIPGVCTACANQIRRNRNIDKIEQSDIVRQELIVLPADCPKEEIGWYFKETIGIGVTHEYFCLPWYKKIFRKKFWRDISCKFRKSKFAQYEEQPCRSKAKKHA